MTKQVTVIWQKEREFIATDHAGGQTGITGPNPEGKGMGASHLLLASLGGCVGTTVIAVLLKRRLDVSGFEIDILGEHMPDWPKTFTGIHLVYKVKGTGIDLKTVERAVELAETKYCTVSASLAPPITREIQLVGEEQAVPA